MGARCSAKTLMACPCLHPQAPFSAAGINLTTLCCKTYFDHISADFSSICIATLEEQASTVQPEILQLAFAMKQLVQKWAPWLTESQCHVSIRCTRWERGLEDECGLSRAACQE